VSTRAEAAPPFDAQQPYRLPEHVSVRPEEFGALLYDHRTRRLLFLKGDVLPSVIERLGDFPSAETAVAGLEPGDRRAVLGALGRLADGGLIECR
jgi:putative mycofactocin binding protein MftB